MNNQSQLEELVKCGICFDGKTNFQVFSCGHSFCAECTSANAKQSQTCPTCRKKIKSTVTNFSLNAIAESILVHKKPNSSRNSLQPPQKVENNNNNNNNHNTEEAVLKMPTRISFPLCPKAFEIFKGDQNFNATLIENIGDVCPTCRTAIDSMLARNIDQAFLNTQSFSFEFLKGSEHWEKEELGAIFEQVRNIRTTSRKKQKTDRIVIRSRSSVPKTNLVDLTDKDFSEESDN